VVPIERLLADAKRFRQRTGRPVITLSYAQSLDGSIAVRRGRPFILSGPESRVVTHKLRGAHDAVLVGIGTVLADNPRLTVRLVVGKNPRPIVLDSRLRFPLDSNLLRNPPVAPLIITTPFSSRDKQEVLEAAGAQVLRMPPNARGWVDLNALSRALAASEVNSVMVEGGARVITSFLCQRLVDCLVLTITPTILGGLRAVERPPSPDGENMPDVAHLPRLSSSGWEQLGADIQFWAMLAWEGE